MSRMTSGAPFTVARWAGPEEEAELTAQTADIRLSALEKWNRRMIFSEMFLPRESGAVRVSSKEGKTKKENSRKSIDKSQGNFSTKLLLLNVDYNATKR